MNLHLKNISNLEIPPLLPAFIETSEIVENIKLYRRQPAQLAALLEAVSGSLHNEMYRQEGLMSDILHDESEHIADAAAAINSELRK